MKILKNPILITFCLIALFIYGANRLALPLPNWIYFYVNDFLCMPIVLSISLAVLRFFKKTDNIYVPLSIILIMTTYYAFYFEWLMPQLNMRYTGDVIDVFLYFMGAVLFYLFQKRLF
ncbi:hypothetical protein [Xanthomarina sp. F2636L]|uniref:hypothetical protein n=1 Tax=Xanthomarina sp. F2636L TaxID=2996018 RepID=UPI00225DF460|nr:hypothetical protein [Xanthomarina sp. F2636L]MCX7551514.1 hypothetical protein [Xanthomarina sp. F2636L]